ncbi:hypothetical protein F5884DRAFT_785858 [Xylogone sp. PMI_703]|nr:hypothetical protein F5884DRAFT_785858 [Xylogone sp. PMI_703]
METHKEFVKWVLSQGLEIEGITVHKFPGRGLGIIAERDLNVGDTLLTAPVSVLRTILTVPKNISKPLGNISVHGLLATELAMDESDAHALWRAVLPSRADIEESIPYMWHESLQALLPPEALSLVENQKRKLSADWPSISKSFPDLLYDRYLYNYFLVGTRTFYFTSPKIKTKRKLTHDDCLALIPLADNFNHADVGCEVTYSPSGYQICAERNIKKGEEVFISYGNHSNDFLLAEYGFILEENKWDEIHLDEVILPLFSEEQKLDLKQANFLGKYVLSKETVCYRTQVALRLLCMSSNKWQRLVTLGLADSDEHQAAVNEILLKALKAYLDIVDEKIKHIGDVQYGLDSQKEVLDRRWKQIYLLLTLGIKRIES